MAALWALQFCKEVEFFEVVFKRDATQVVTEINSAPPHLSMIGHLIESIIQELQGFRSALFVHVNQESNSTAHVLAKEAAKEKIDLCRLEDISRSMSHIVFRELVCP